MNKSELDGYSSTFHEEKLDFFFKKPPINIDVPNLSLTILFKTNFHFSKKLKMTPLKINQRILTWLCVYPVNGVTSKCKHLSYILCTVLTLAANICGLLASSACFAKFVSNDMELSLHALLQICALSSATYMMIIALFSRRNVKMIFDSLAKIHDSGKNVMILWLDTMARYYGSILWLDNMARYYGSIIWLDTMANMAR